MQGEFRGFGQEEFRRFGQVKRQTAYAHPMAKELGMCSIAMFSASEMLANHTCMELLLSNLNLQC